MNGKMSSRKLACSFSARWKIQVNDGNQNQQSSCSCLSKFLQEQSITSELNEHYKLKTHQVYISESKG